MILIERKPLETVGDVRDRLQFAIEIEHATIPPYLMALYSLGTQGNDEIRAILRGIVIEEMGHMALAANILVAIGGSPRFTDPGFVPAYPGGLPFKIGDRHGKNLEIHLAPFSKALVHDTFMVIEMPEDPIHFPVRPRMAAFAAALGVAQETFQTIGEFYDDLAAKLTELGDGIFTGTTPQPTGFPHDVFAVRSLADALRAIALIVQQGEGTKTKPLAGEGSALAHYYRFEEIWKGRRLVADPSTPLGYSFSGGAIPFDRSGVANIVTDGKTAEYVHNPMALRLAQQFNASYAALLAALEQAYNGHPDVLTNAIGLMYDLLISSQLLMAQPVDPASAVVPVLCAAPTFEFPPPVVAP